MPHHRETAPNFRLRHWASRLVLLVAGVSVVATSQVRSADVFSAPYTGQPVTLTAEAPRVTLPLVVGVTASKSPDKQAEALMRVKLTVRWTPEDPSQTKAGPILRASLLGNGTQLSGPEAATSPLVAGQPLPMDVLVSHSRNCELGKRCQWTSDLRLELESQGAAGTVEVAWTATAQAHVVGTSSTPEGFTVTVSEP
ncbi:hypothetical protein [Corallococcus carmarthensis]|uniref:Uncharacterized protein n=1 Tax=Corallococcus carmarthensis TaxID=2316728 RepID=A0A3A8KBF5_9BACT|nr:hypothetical protein [Corallococcus carmarthensis]NOK15964.1 hypothetical protein [Corallococcus carmarthensis]RKH04846.1 hypothetical protein D7X32_09630 [Corallococcus carmarthensis]